LEHAWQKEKKKPFTPGMAAGENCKSSFWKKLKCPPRRGKRKLPKKDKEPIKKKGKKQQLGKRGRWGQIDAGRAQYLKTVGKKRENPEARMGVRLRKNP